MFVSSSYQKLLEFYFTLFDVNLSCFSIERSQDVNGYRLRSNLKQNTDNHFFIKDVIGSGLNFAIAS